MHGASHAAAAMNALRWRGPSTSLFAPTETPPADLEHVHKQAVQHVQHLRTAGRPASCVRLVTAVPKRRAVASGTLAAGPPGKINNHAPLARPAARPAHLVVALIDGHLHVQARELAQVAVRVRVLGQRGGGQGQGEVRYELACDAARSPWLRQLSFKPALGKSLDALTPARSAHFGGFPLQLLSHSRPHLRTEHGANLKHAAQVGTDGHLLVELRRLRQAACR